MKKILNNPNEFVVEMLDGLLKAHPDQLSYAGDDPHCIVRADAPIASVADLRGKRIGLSSRLSISSIGGARWLQEQGLQMGRDYPIFERATHGAAIAAVAVGELDAALTTHTPAASSGV